MAWQRCNTCNGTYQTETMAGAAYFHVCPTIVLVTVTRAGVEQHVPIADVQPTDLLTVERAGATLTVAAGDVQPADRRLGDTSGPRPNARNENVRPDRLTGNSPATGDDRLISPGAGAVPIAAPVVTPVGPLSS